MTRSLLTCSSMWTGPVCSIVNCNAETVNVDATSVWKPDGKGLLPGEWYGYLAFYGFLAIAYLVVAFAW